MVGKGLKAGYRVCVGHQYGVDVVYLLIADHLRIGSRVNTLPCYDALVRTMHTTVEYDTHDIVCTVKFKKKLPFPFHLPLLKW